MTWMSWISMVLVLVGIGGCRSDQCAQLRTEHSMVLEAQKAVVAELSADTPVQIGLQIHEDLLTEVVHKAISGRETVRVNESVPGGRLMADISLTRARVRLGKNCDDCVEIEGRLSMRSTVTAGSLTVFRGRGGADLLARVPLVLGLEEGRSTLAVDLRRVDVRRLKVRGAGGADLPWNRLLSSAAQKLLRSAGTRVTVASWKPSGIPGTGMAAAARELKIFPRQKTAWIGFAVATPHGSKGLAPRATLGRGETVAVSFSGAVLTSLMQGLVHSGEVPARLDDDFKPDPDGANLATLDRVVPDEEGLLTDFTIWHLPADESTCYAADVRARTVLHVEQSRRAGQLPIRMRMSDGEVVNTRGDDVLLTVGLWLRSVFVSDALEAQSRVLAADTFGFGPLGTRQIHIERLDYSSERLEVAGVLTAAE